MIVTHTGKHPYRQKTQNLLTHNRAAKAVPEKLYELICREVLSKFMKELQDIELGTTDVVSLLQNLQ